MGSWIEDTGADEEWSEMDLFLCLCQRYRSLFLGSQMLNVGGRLEVEIKRKGNCYLRDKKCPEDGLTVLFIGKGNLMSGKVYISVYIYSSQTKFPLMDFYTKTY